MSDYEIWLGVISGSVRDPILWIVAVIFGWDRERGLRQTAQFLLAAGFIWGCIRVAVYSSFGTQLSVAQGLIMVGVCVGFMMLVGGSIRLARGLLSGESKRRD